MHARTRATSRPVPRPPPATLALSIRTRERATRPHLCNSEPEVARAPEIALRNGDGGRRSPPFYCLRRNAPVVQRAIIIAAATLVTRRSFRHSRAAAIYCSPLDILLFQLLRLLLLLLIRRLLVPEYDLCAGSTCLPDMYSMIANGRQLVRHYTSLVLGNKSKTHAHNTHTKPTTATKQQHQKPKPKPKTKWNQTKHYPPGITYTRHQVYQIPRPTNQKCHHSGQENL